jgi:hypothetical protein
VVVAEPSLYGDAGAEVVCAVELWVPAQPKVTAATTAAAPMVATKRTEFFMSDS